MAESLTVLKHKRASIRSNLTRFRTFFDSLTLDNLTTVKYNELKTRLFKFEPGYDEFTQVQLDIACALENSTLTAEQMEVELDEKNYFDDYFNLRAAAQTALDSYEDLNNDRGSLSNRSVNQNVGQGHNNSQLFPQSKLPLLSIPTFEGKIEKWMEFKDAFLAIVDTNFNLPPVQKFQYLKSALKGEAEELVASIEITSSNFDVAWSLLEERYENNRLIIDTYIQGLLDAPVLTKESHVELRRLFDIFSRNIRSLKALKQPTDSWDTLLIAIIVNKFDSQTRREWEAYEIAGDFPVWSELNTFLKAKCSLLEKLEMTKIKIVPKQPANKFDNKDIKQNRYRGSFTTVKQCRKISCYFCRGEHSIFECDKFKNLSVGERSTEVRKLKLCINCFNPNHTVQDCIKTSCRICNFKHNSMLHRDKNSTNGSQHSRSDDRVENRENNNSASPVTALTSAINRQSGGGGTGGIPDRGSESGISTYSTETTVENNINSFTGLNKQNKDYPLLSTALVNIVGLGLGNKMYTARILVDQGSQSNFISLEFAKKVGLELKTINYAVSGVGDKHNLSIKLQTSVTIHSRINDYKCDACCLVLDKITSRIPLFSFGKKSINIPKNISLADPSFNVSQDIDMLVGVEIFYDILLMEQIKINNGLTLQKTELGWLLGGKLTFPVQKNMQLVSCLSTEDAINEILIRFWQIEEPQNIKSNIDEFCENNFIQTVDRDPTGRFIVQIPFKDNLNELGDSKLNAMRSLDYLQKKFNKNPELKKEYKAFISEYESLGHMSEKKIDIWKDSTDNECYYLPHHAVIKETSLTCRLRVVFNASSKTTSGLSLNDVQYTGPTIQNDLVAILTRFRKYKYILSADVSKMYRQILINPKQRPYQRILWRTDNDELKCFELNTVVYGMASSPFLAIRCLQQLATDFEGDFPVATQVIKTDFYMDDLLTGTNDENDLLALQRDITNILASAGFDLRKWLSNKRDFTEYFQLNDNLQTSTLQIGESEQNKTLGVYWNAFSDKLKYRIKNFDNQSSSVTKRKILSISSQIFDPLGLVQPVILVAKLIIQSLWKEKSDWDSEVSNSLRDTWNNFCSDLQYLNDLSVSRRIFSDNPRQVELHVFADASEKAFGSAIYLRCINFDDTCTSHLLCAKSKVAPTKQQQLTLAKLELSAALLATKLAKRVLDSIDFEFNHIYYWSDSTITLCWIKGDPDRWKTFVRNRVIEIQNLTNTDNWFHVRSEQNPADFVSRGSTALQLISNELWFEGPSWLKCSTLPLTRIDENAILVLPEQRTICNLSKINNFDEFNLFTKYSSISKLQRVMAYCYRFLNNTRYKKLKTDKNLSVNLRSQELTHSLESLIRISQVQSFGQVYFDLCDKKAISSSTISSLNPFIDEKGLIRVGGRIQNAKLDYSKRFPILLYKKHTFTKLIFEFYHKVFLHVGPQQLLYLVRQKYWAISGRSLARSITHKCVACFKAKPKPSFVINSTLNIM